LPMTKASPMPAITWRSSGSRNSLPANEIRSSAGAHGPAHEAKRPPRALLTDA
jgi:hypothetical protein